MSRVRLYGLAILAIAVAPPAPVVAGPPECSDHCFAWQERSVGPEARTGHAMVYDELRDVLVLFGGGYQETLGDTWERRDGEWQLRDCSGPAPRSGHAMVYDSLRGVTVLFGGSNYPQTFGDTWEWDGVSWTLVAQTGPAPRSRHAMAFDRERGRTVLFGGAMEPQFYGDTWEWDGVAWTQIDTQGPSARYGSSMTFDERRGVTVMYGGFPSDSDEGLVWEWDGGSWYSVVLGSQFGPGIGYFEPMTFDPNRGTAVLFVDSWCPEPCLQVWEWDGAEWNVREDRSLLYGPSESAAAFDRRLGIARIFGGNSLGEQIANYGFPSDDLWGLNPDGWVHVSAGGPIGRWNHAMAFDGSVVMFGGIAGTRYPVDPVTWEWDGTKWYARSDWGPSPRQGHAMTFDSERALTLLFGGGVYPPYTDPFLWAWDGRSWFPIVADGPSARAQHAMVYDSQRRVTVMFGGTSSEYDGQSFGDTWEWDGEQWSWRNNSGPAPRYRHTMAFDSRRNVTVLFGGIDSECFGDTWEWDGIEWRLRSTSGPAPRSEHAMVYDELTERTILFGGHGCAHGDSYWGDTWSWDGTNWTLLSLSGPMPRSGHAMAYDPNRHAVVLMGGSESSRSYYRLGDLWEFDSTMNDDQDYDGVVDDCDQCPLTGVGFGALATGCTPLDHDLDDDGDLFDFQTLQNCMGLASDTAGCGTFDRDNDYVVGVIDAVQMFPTLAGPR